MIRARSGWRRAVGALSLAASALLLGGCVYLRLLEVKRQLAQFDRHFLLKTDDGLRLTCLTPVLEADDIRWLGLRPESIKRLGQAEQWHVRWVKQLPPGKTESGAFHIAVDLSFTQGKLTGIAIPERYFQLLPKSFVIGVIRSVGGARIDKSDRSAEAAVTDAAALARPDLPGIDKVLGMPTEERLEGNVAIQRYRYVTATTEPKPGVFEMTLRFDDASGQLLHWQGRTPVGNIAFKFAP
jgi:hypothetical protein